VVLKKMMMTICSEFESACLSFCQAYKRFK
jgi:hypothetical protein